jgi:hypothetical protein
MTVPERIDRLAGRHALVDGLPFELPVVSRDTSALMAAFSIDPVRARALIASEEIHPFRLWNRGLLVVTVVDYRDTSIGSYIEYSIAIACTRGLDPAPRLIPGLFTEHYGVGQYVVDLPVSTEISVKGGKGIWGMPKHRASLDFQVSDRQVSSQYDLDGQLATYVEIERPRRAWFPMQTGAVNYCAFRGMLMKSTIYFKGQAGLHLFGKARGRFVVGDHPRTRPLRDLDIRPQPIFTAYLPKVTGTLDDHFESWFLTSPTPPRAGGEGRAGMEGMESVVDLGLGQSWPPAPSAPVPEDGR